MLSSIGHSYPWLQLLNVPFPLGSTAKTETETVGKMKGFREKSDGDFSVDSTS